MKPARQFYIIRFLSHSLISFLGIMIGVFGFYALHDLIGWRFNDSLIVSSAFGFFIALLLHFARNRADQRPFDDIQTWLDTERNHRDIDEQISVLNANKYASHFISQFWELLNNPPGKKVDDPIELQAIQAKMQTVFDELSVGIITMDSDGKISNCNQTGSEVLGFRDSELIGSPLIDTIRLKRYGSPIIKTWLEANQAKVKAENHWRDIEYQTPIGEQKYFEIFAKYNRSDKNGNDTILTIIDRTSEQDQEDQKVDFVAIVAHELRAPITVIRGYLQVFEDEVADKLDKDQKEFLQKMYVSAEQLGSFVNNILSAARIDRGELVVNQTKTNWQDLIASVAQDLAVRAEAHGKKLSYTLPDTQLPPVAVDSAMIEHTIINLVDNAIKYGASHDNIMIDVKLDGDMVQTTVTDHGIGIPGSLVSNMFTKFYRSHRSKRQFGGSGLGLFLSKTIVDAHGGKIWVNSQEDKGSTFGFTVPTYKKFATDAQAEDNDGEVIQTGHGWIKNHSLYRR